MTTLYLLARIVLGIYFVYSGLLHLTKTGALAEYARSKKIPAPTLAVLVSGIVLALGGFGILFEQHLALSYQSIAAFLVIAAITVHDFWHETDVQTKMMSSIQFQKNLAIASALLLLSAN